MILLMLSSLNFVRYIKVKCEGGLQGPDKYQKFKFWVENNW